MANKITNTSNYSAIADAIRGKLGVSTTYTPGEMAAAIENIPTGGGSSSAPKKQVNFIDYDGQILHSYTKAEIEAMTSQSDLPSNPSHAGLVSQGWNWTLAEIKTQLAAMPGGDVWVGQMYITQSGDTEIDCEFHEGRLSPILTIGVNGTVTIDWGDGTASSELTGTSLASYSSASHSYERAGAYTIKIHVVTGSFQFYGSTSYFLLRKNSTGNENRVYSNAIKAVRIGMGISKIGSYAFYRCDSLASITIPNSITSIGDYAFNYCYALNSITIPSGETVIATYAFSSCSSISNISIPSSVIAIGSNAFYACYGLSSITIPNGVIEIGGSTFYLCSTLTSIVLPNGITTIANSLITTCSSLTSLTIPSSVTDIGTSAFANCYGLAEIHFLSETPPSLSKSNCFNNIPSDCIIYVPASAVNAYKSATYWSDRASQIRGE